MTRDTEAPSPASTNGQWVSRFLRWDPYCMSSERRLVQPLWGQQGLVGGARVPQAWARPTVRRGRLPSLPPGPARRPAVGTRCACGESCR